MEKGMPIINIQTTSEEMGTRYIVGKTFELLFMTSHYCYFTFSGALQTVDGGKWQRKNRKDEKVEIHFHFALDPHFFPSPLLLGTKWNFFFFFSIVYLHFISKTIFVVVRSRHKH